MSLASVADSSFAARSSDSDDAFDNAFDDGTSTSSERLDVDAVGVDASPSSCASNSLAALHPARRFSFSFSRSFPSSSDVATSFSFPFFSFSFFPFVNAAARAANSDDFHSAMLDSVTDASSSGVKDLARACSDLRKGSCGGETTLSAR